MYACLAAVERTSNDEQSSNSPVNLVLAVMGGSAWETCIEMLFHNKAIIFDSRSQLQPNVWSSLNLFTSAAVVSYVLLGEFRLAVFRVSLVGCLIISLQLIVHCYSLSHWRLRQRYCFLQLNKFDLYFLICISFPFIFRTYCNMLMKWIKLKLN